MTNLMLMLVRKLIEQLVENLDTQTVKGAIDKAFDYVEEKVEDSSTPWDDITVIPILEGLRKALNVPDGDE